MVQSEIAYRRADDGVAQQELVAESEQTQSELQLNKELTRSFTKDTVQRKTVNPLQIKINSLQTQHKRLQQSIDIRVADLQKKHAMDQVEQINQIRMLEQELDLMH